MYIYIYIHTYIHIYIYISHQRLRFLSSAQDALGILILLFTSSPPAASVKGSGERRNEH